MTKIEAGTYTRYQTPTGVVLEVFRVTEVAGNEADPLTVGKYYCAPSDGGDPIGPFDTEGAALDVAF